MLFALIALHENSKIAELNDKIYRHPFSVSNAVLEANSDIIAMHRYMKDVVLAVNQEELEIATSLVDFHEQQDHLFKAPWLDQLQQAHDVMHFVANELVNSHATGKNPTKNELDRLHIAFNKYY